MKYTFTEALLALFILVAASVCEISGGWLIWKWRRDGGHWFYLIIGGIILVAYGIVATFQRQGFGRTYAAYGAFFVMLSLFWGWVLEGGKPDLWDWLGGFVAVGGACIILFVPRCYP